MGTLMLVVLAGGMVVALWRYQVHQTNMWRQSGIADIDHMSGVEFEQRLVVLFWDLGYAVETTPPSGDYGADLIVSQSGTRMIVQAKRSSRTVGVKAVQEVVGALQFYGGTVALVVTNAQFSSNAQTMASRLGVILWDRAYLVRQLATTHPTNALEVTPYQVPIRGDGWISPLLQWIENEHRASHLRGRQVLAIMPLMDDERIRTATMIRLDKNLDVIDDDDTGLYAQGMDADTLHNHLKEIPDYGVLWIFGLEQWDPDLLLQTLFPWREQVFVVAFSAYPDQIEPIIRAQFFAEVPFRPI